jgi:valyl-tRNA synthetase
MDLLRNVEYLFQNFQYGEAGRQIYDFFWSEFADWYLEIAKLQIAEGGSRAFYTVQRLVQVLDTCLRLLHPFTPFITEELWGHLKSAAEKHSDQLKPAASEWEEALIIARWPEAMPVESRETGTIADFDLVQEVVRSIRNLRAEKNVNPGLRIPAILSCPPGPASLLLDEAGVIASLARLDADNIKVVLQGETPFTRPEGYVALVAGPVEIYLPLKEMIDTSEERQRMQKELAEIQAQVERLQNLLAGSFAEKAPAAVVQKERDRLAAFLETAARLREQIQALD